MLRKYPCWSHATCKLVNYSLHIFYLLQNRLTKNLQFNKSVNCISAYIHIKHTDHILKNLNYTKTQWHGGNPFLWKPSLIYSAWINLLFALECGRDLIKSPSTIIAPLRVKVRQFEWGWLGPTKVTGEIYIWSDIPGGLLHTADIIRGN